MARCDGSSIRNPAGYLFGIIQRAIRGEFNAWAGERQSAQPTPSRRPPAKPHGPPPKPPVPPEPPVPREPPVPPEVARQHIAHLRELMCKR